MFKKKKSDKRKNKESQLKYSKNLTVERKNQLIEEVDVILSKLTDKDIEYFEENDDFTEEEIKYMKKRKKLRASKRAIFYSRIRCDEETLNRILKTTNQIIKQNRQRQIKSREDRKKINEDKVRTERIRVKKEFDIDNR